MSTIQQVPIAMGTAHHCNTMHNVVQKTNPYLLHLTELDTLDKIKSKMINTNKNH